MENLKNTALGLGVLFGLVACGGGATKSAVGGAPQSTTLAPVETGSPNAGFTNDNFALTYNGEIVSRATDPKLDNGSTFVHFFSRNVTNQPSGSQLGNGKVQTIRANTGQTHAFVFGNDVRGPLFTQFGRSVATEMPTTGSATYKGNYGGLTKISGGTRPFQILGDTEMNINFENATASGVISNRRIATGTTKFDNINLVGGVIDQNGLIKGTALGGRPSGLNATNLPGRPFEAVIGAEDASEVAGYLRVDWRTSGGTTYNEAGAFSARRE